MSEPGSLGWRPAEGWNVNLGRDNDFLQTLTRADGSPWPVGATLELVIKLVGVEVARWPAAMAGPDASWAVPADTVNAVLDAIAYKSTTTAVEYGDANVQQTWMTGKVETY